jgi:chitodextrinase
MFTLSQALHTLVSGVYMKAFTIGVVLSIFVCVPFATVATAQSSDQFIVRTFIGVDDPPTAPSSLTASPTSPTSIMVTWIAAIDDIGVQAYEIFRDSLFVATVTAPQTTYADLGRQASTSYEYMVRAIDVSGFYSVFSSSTATSTYEAPVVVTPATTTRRRGESSKVSVIPTVNVSAMPSAQSISLTISADEEVSVVVSWGGSQTTGGTLTIPGLLRLHTTTISGLRPGNSYDITVVATNRDGTSLTKKIRVGTLAGSDDVPPSTPSQFNAKSTEAGIQLLWKNPTDEDFELVRVMRLTGSIPVDPYDGNIIYEGKLQSFLDTTVASETVYGYSLFSRDISGNYSSGATLIVRSFSKEGIGESAIDIDHAPTSTPIVAIGDLTVTQEGVTQWITDGTLRISEDEAFVLRIPTSVFPKVLKTILVTLRHPDRPKETFTFLLRANKERTAYEAHLSGLDEPGRYEVTIASLDLTSTIISKNTFALIVTPRTSELTQTQTHTTRTFTLFARIAFFLILILLLMLAGYTLYRRAHQHMAT